METLLPKFPRTRHLPFEPNATRDDLVASMDEIAAIFNSNNVEWTEKIDGANVGIAWDGENPIVRNRNHILNKGYMKDTPAKKQFRPLWNWVYENYENFKKLSEVLGFNPSVYGEWLYAVHGIIYDSLPSYFMAFDIYDPERDIFIAPPIARKALIDCGFQVPPIVHEGKIESLKSIALIRDRKSSFSKVNMEGLYIKVFDGEKILDRFKVVRQDFICGEHWTKDALKKNSLKKVEKI